MVHYFLAIGELSSEGVFKDSKWQAILLWFKQHVDSVLIYSSLNGESMQRSVTNSFWKKITSNSPFAGESSPLFGYFCLMQNDNDWLEFEGLRISPNDGITHLFFYRMHQLIAAVQVEDGYNFIDLSLSLEERTVIAESIPNLKISRVLCDQWKLHIDELAGGKSWKPL